VFRILSIVFLLALIAFPALGWWFAQRSLPVLDGVVTLPQLSRNVMVKFDERALPYIQASSDHDLFFAQGYLTASQRMFQMDISRRTAKGELADLLGTPLLAQDKINRSIGFNRMAASEWKRLSKDARSHLSAYSDGVNAYLKEYGGKAGFEFLLLGKTANYWNPADCLAILKYKQYEMEESWRLDDLRQRTVDKVGDKLAQKLFNQVLRKNVISWHPTNFISSFAGVKPALPVWGSNSWLVAGQLSDSKSSILSCDKHSSFTSPDEWFLCSLETGERHLAGATIPGVPGILLGRNKDIAWSSVALRADTQDIFVEQFSPQFPGKYRTSDGWETATEIEEVIPVRFANPIQYKVEVTKHGPLLFKEGNAGVSLQWSGAEDTKQTKPVMETIFEINEAKDWQTFSSAISHYTGASQTFCYADTKGNIGYHGAGNIPVRAVGAGSQLNQAWNSNTDWKGKAAFASLPNTYNPSQHYAVADDPGAFGSYNFSNPYRALRIASVLAGLKQGGHKIGLPDMATLQGDELTRLYPLVRKEIKQATTRAEIVDRYELNALDILNKWDGSASGDSTAASIYESFIATFAKRILEPKLGTTMTHEYMQQWPRWSVFIEQILTEKPVEWLPPEEKTYETFFITTFASALKNIHVALKTDDASQWQWQNLHQVNFQNKLFESNSFLSPIFSTVFFQDKIGVGGDQDTVNACNIAAAQPPWSFMSDSGPTCRLLIDMSDSDKFYEAIPLGQSGHLLSGNRQDQTKAWLTNAPHAVAFSSDQLEKQMQHKLILSTN